MWGANLSPEGSGHRKRAGCWSSLGHVFIGPPHMAGHMAIEQTQQNSDATRTFESKMWVRETPSHEK